MSSYEKIFLLPIKQILKNTARIVMYLKIKDIVMRGGQNVATVVLFPSAGYNTLSIERE